VKPPPQTTGLSTNFTQTRNRSVNQAIKSKIMQTLTLSTEGYRDFKSLVQSRHAATQSTTGNPGRLNLTRTMKPNLLTRLVWDRGEIVASFGTADLIRHHDGRLELRGGSPSDHATAREWCSLFQHEATFPSAPLPLTAPLPQPPKAVHNRILIADDDALVRGSVAAVLESEGYVVDEAHNGIEAVTRALEHSPDLVLLDLNMPHWDGWTAFSQLDRVTPLLPIIVITARPNQYEKAVRLGVDAFMEKPLDFPTLLEAIVTLIKEEPARHIRRVTDREFVTRLLPTRAKEFRP
jgi:CheY-like chemotaxis protein